MIEKIKTDNLLHLYSTYEILDYEHNKKDGIYNFYCIDHRGSAPTSKIFIVDADIVEKFNNNTSAKIIYL